ncbi:hypothetical protein CB1_001251014 [Camelus ferus]|nr:hypothetical protein CB1_001251014 [Camelus ferus]
MEGGPGILAFSLNGESGCSLTMSWESPQPKEIVLIPQMVSDPGAGELLYRDSQRKGSINRTSQGPATTLSGAQPTPMDLVSGQQFVGGSTKAPEEAWRTRHWQQRAAAAAWGQPCKWSHQTPGLCLLFVTTSTKVALYFVPQNKLHLEGFWNLKEGEAVEFTFKEFP